MSWTGTGLSLLQQAAVTMDKTNVSSMERGVFLSDGEVRQTIILH